MSSPRKKYSFDIERSIATWRQFLLRERSVSEEDLKELEAHLRDEMAHIRRPRMSDEEIYRRALQSIGDYATVGSAYRDVFWEKGGKEGNLMRELAWRFHLTASYVRLAWRNVLRHKGYALLNITGVSIGLATCLVIGVFVHQNLIFDRFHEDAGQIYRITNEWGSGRKYGMTSWGVADLIENELIGVEKVTELSGWSSNEWQFTIDGQHYSVSGVVNVDDHFLDMFSFPISRGDADHPLSAPGSIVITESTAKRLFGDRDPVGVQVRINARSDYTITAIAEDPPRQTQLLFSVLSYTPRPQKEIVWNNIAVNTYVKLFDGVSPESLERQLDNRIQESDPTNFKRGFRIHLQPISGIHLGSDIVNGFSPTMDSRQLILFGAIGFLVLLLACINYMNLGTARATRRAREVGVRKVVGATRNQLRRQFIGESMLLSILSLPVAFVFVILALPAVNSISGQNLTAQMFNYPAVWIGLACLILVIGIGGGSYPAFLLSRFRPEAVFKGRMVLGTRQHTVRRILVGIQVIASFSMIVITLVLTAQLSFISEQNLGFVESQIIILKPSRWDAARIESYKSRILGDPSIEGVASGPPLGTGMRAMSWAKPLVEGGESIRFAMTNVGYGFLDLLGVEVLKGRTFMEEISGDPGRAVVLSQSMARALQLGDDPIGQIVNFNDEKEVIGVVADIQNVSLQRDDGLLWSYELDPDISYGMAVRLSAGQTGRGLQVLEEAWKQISPERMFSFEFLDELIRQQYEAESKLARIFTLFSLLSVVVACMGLFGLAAYSAEQRTKEIGIRKALGSTVSNIVVLLSREFVLIVLVSIAVVSPFVYIVGTKWLENFSKHVEIGPTLFLSAGAISLGFVMVAVGFQALKAALANPSDALRHE